MLQQRSAIIAGCRHGKQRQVAAAAVRTTSAAGKPRQQHPSSSRQAAAAAAPWQQQQQQRAQATRVRASDDEDAEIDRMAREAAQPDIWSSDLVGNAVKVALGAAVVAAVLLIGSLAKPLYDNTIKSFPTPAEFEAYEQRQEEGDLF